MKFDDAVRQVIGDRADEALRELGEMKITEHSLDQIIPKTQAIMFHGMNVNVFIERVRAAMLAGDEVDEPGQPDEQPDEQPEERPGEDALPATKDELDTMDVNPRYANILRNEGIVSRAQIIGHPDLSNIYGISKQAAEVILELAQKEGDL